MNGSRRLTTILLSSVLLLAVGYGVISDGWRSPPGMFVKAQSAALELPVGASVYAADGTNVGTVAGISHAPNNQIERIRVHVSSPSGQRMVAIRPPVFTVTRGAVRLTLSVVEVNALPSLMMRDGAAG